MPATIDIIGRSGIKHSAVFEKESVRKFELMKEDYVRLVFSASAKFNLSVGDYIEIGQSFDPVLRGKFEITKPQKPKFNKDTGGYDYDIQFDAPHYKWNNKLFKFEPSTNRNEANWSLTDNLLNHMAVFLRNVQHYGWKFANRNYVVATNSLPASASRNIFIQYNNKYLLDALTLIAESFECEWWITNNVIHFGKCENGTAIQLKIGDNVESMDCEKSNQPYISRLYAFGSDRNIPPDYRNNDEQVLMNGVVQKRLMLPESTPYVDIVDGLPDDEAVEGVVILDDVFPRMDCEITDLQTDIREVEDETSDEEGATISVPIYRFKSSSIEFLKDYLLPGQNLQVQFLSGSLNGMIFDLAFNPDGAAEKVDGQINPDSQWFEIIRNETYGLYLPNDTLKPSEGGDGVSPDRFVLLGWNVKKLQSGLNLVTAAENELLTRIQEYAQKQQIDPNVYPCRMMSDYMYGLDNLGNQDANYSKVGIFPLGKRIKLVNGNFFDSSNPNEEGFRNSRVIGFEYKLDKPYDGAIIYVGESATYSSKKDSEAKINEAMDAINYQGMGYSPYGGSSKIYIITTDDNTSPSDSNVYSALKSERSFARKDKDDAISSLWTFNHANGQKRGLQTREYITYGAANEDNMFGKGFELISRTVGGSSRTRLEVDELLVRMRAIFATLEIREISYLGGNYLFSSAGSKIYYVDWIGDNDAILEKTEQNISLVKKFRCYLYSDDGTTATENRWVINDQALCQTFNIDSGVHEDTSNKRYWRLVLATGKQAIPNSGNATQYQYIDLSNNANASEFEANSDIPEANDTIVQCGNWSNDARQGVIYIKVEGEGSPAIIEYSGVGSNGYHFLLPNPTLLLSPSKNVIYGEFHSVVSSGGNTGSGATIADQISALLSQLTATITKINNLAEDGILTPSEKLTILREWDAVYNEYATLKAQADQIHMDSSEYTTAYFKLGNYLNDKTNTATDRSGSGANYVTPLLLSASGDTTINGSTFKTLWSNYYKERTDLLAAISNYSASRSMIANMVNLIYAYNSGYIREKSSNQYVKIFFGTGVPGSATNGDMYYASNAVNKVGRYENNAWATISNTNLQKALDDVYKLIGYGESKDIRIYRSKPSHAVRKYDVICSGVFLTDNHAPTGYKNIECGIYIIMYNGTEWEVIQESAHSIIENLPGYVRAMVNNGLNTSGFITSSDWASLFSQATDADGNILAQAHIATKVSDGNGGYKISGATIDADQVNITGTDQISLAISNAVAGVKAYGPNLLPHSIINEKSSAYGFAMRSLNLEGGKKYTISASGIVHPNVPSHMKFRIFIWRYYDSTDGNANQTGVSWACAQRFDIEKNAGAANTGSVTFTADKSATFYICAYLYNTDANAGNIGDGGGEHDRDYKVTLLWYKVEEGEKATPWVQEESDENGLENWVVNPIAVNAERPDTDDCTYSEQTDSVFGKVIQISHSTAAHWQLKFTMRDNHSTLRNNPATYYVICKCVGNYEGMVTNSSTGTKTRARLRFCYQGGNEIIALDTNTAPFVDLGNGWRKYYMTNQDNAINQSTVGIFGTLGTWQVYAVGIVRGGVCPLVAEIMARNSLLKTGIDITAGKIELRADKVTFTNSDGSVSGKVFIDSTTGALHAVDGVFSGSINASGSIGTTGKVFNLMMNTEYTSFTLKGEREVVFNTNTNMPLTPFRKHDNCISGSFEYIHIGLKDWSYNHGDRATLNPTIDLKTPILFSQGWYDCMKVRLSPREIIFSGIYVDDETGIEDERVGSYFGTRGVYSNSSFIKFSGLSDSPLLNFSDNNDAKNNGGLEDGQLYRSGDVLKIVHS